jgi:hypothetical protein
MALQERFGSMVTSVAARWQRLNPASAPDPVHSTEVRPDTNPNNVDPYLHDPVFGDYRVYVERMKILRTRSGIYSDSRTTRHAGTPTGKPPSRSRARVSGWPPR